MNVGDGFNYKRADLFGIALVLHQFCINVNIQIRQHTLVGINQRAKFFRELLEVSCMYDKSLVDCFLSNSKDTKIDDQGTN